MVQNWIRGGPLGAKTLGHQMLESFGGRFFRDTNSVDALLADGFTIGIVVATRLPITKAAGLFYHTGSIIDTAEIAVGTIGDS